MKPVKEKVWYQMWHKVHYGLPSQPCYQEFGLDRFVDRIRRHEWRQTTQIIHHIEYHLGNIE